ncbi:MAG: hypothetical protein AB7F76_05200 [Parvibaculaceae bacterium]
MKKQGIHQESGLAYEIWAIMVAVALCIGTYFAAGAFDAPPLKSFADAAGSQP